MAELSVKPPPPDDEEELETKPFLDHLEDLRWTLLKSITALFVFMCVAFYGLPWLMAALELPLHGVGEVLEEPQLLRSADLKDSAAMVARFKEPADPLSRYMADRLSTDTKKQVQQAAPAGRTPKALRTALVDDLNLVLKGECIYTPERFAQIKLSDDVQARLERKPSGNQLIRLNRWLLEEAYPREIGKGLGPVEFDAGRFLYTIGPGEVFIFSIKLALYAGTILAMPFILYFIGQFILPALTRREKRYLWPAFALGGGLFLIGAGFCFFYVMPKALVVSIAWAKWMNLNVTFWRVGEYVAFVCGFMLGMGLAFETPVVLLSLVKMGVLSHAGLRKGRRYWMVFSLVAGALLTTPEVFTQLVMAVVLIGLYELSIWGAWLIERHERARDLAAEKEDAAAIAAPAVAAGTAATTTEAAAGGVAEATPPTDPDVPADRGSESYGSGEGDTGSDGYGGESDTGTATDGSGESSAGKEEDDTTMH